MFRFKYFHNLKITECISNQGFERSFSVKARRANTLQIPEAKRIPQKNGYFIRRAPGVRAIELDLPEKGNFLHPTLLNSLESKVTSYFDNVIVNVVIFHSFAEHKMFSLGIHPVDYSNNRDSCLESIYRFSNSIHKISTELPETKKPLMAPDTDLVIASDLQPDKVNPVRASNQEPSTEDTTAGYDEQPEIDDPSYAYDDNLVIEDPTYNEQSDIEEPYYPNDDQLDSEEPTYNEQPYIEDPSYQYDEPPDLEETSTPNDEQFDSNDPASVPDEPPEPKRTIASYSGKLNGTALAVFSRCTYRFGSLNTDFCMDEMFNCMLPVGGAAHFIVNNCDHGVAFARFLAVSARACSSEELYALGLLTHVVEDDPHIAIGAGLGESSPVTYAKKAEQYSMANMTSFDELLDTMNIDCDFDVLKSPVWRTLSSVPPTWVIPSNPEDPDDLDVMEGVIAECFSAATPEETQQLLRDERFRADVDKRPSLRTALENFKTLSPVLVKSWYELTAAAVHQSIEESYAMEREICKALP